MKLNSPRALLRSYVKDAYRIAVQVRQFLQLDLPAQVIVDRSLAVENPSRIHIEPGVTIERGVRLLCSTSGAIILRRGVALGQGVTLVVDDAGIIEIGPGTAVGTGVHMRTRNRIGIGRDSMVMQFSSIEPREPDECGVLETGERVTIHAHNWLDTTGSIRIGSDTHTGPFSLFYTHNHRYDKPGSIWDQGVRIEDIALGEGIWMGSKAMIMPGAVVGDGSVIAAGSIVTKRFGAGEVVGGAPAASLRKRHGT